MYRGDPFAKIIASIVGQQLSSRLDRGSLGPHPELRGPEAGIVFLRALEHEEQNLESVWLGDVSNRDLVVAQSLAFRHARIPLRRVMSLVCGTCVRFR